MPRLLSSKTVPVIHHVLIDKAVAHIGLFIVDPGNVKGFVEADVGHDRSHYRIGIQHSPLLHVKTADIKNQISVYHTSVLIHRNTPVRVAVIGKTHIQPVFHHKLL